MAIAELLQDFGSSVPGAEALTLISASEMETQSIASYERGYAAGWEDSLTLQIEEKSKLSDALRRNLEDLDFTVAEARRQMMTAVTPIFEALVDQVLPQALSDNAGPVIVEKMQQMVREVGAGPIRFSTAPGTAQKIRPVVEHATDARVTITEDASLTGDQVTLGIADCELVFDPDAVIVAFRTTVDGFAHAIRTETKHG